MTERGTLGETGQDFGTEGVDGCTKPETKWNSLGRGRVGGVSV